MSVTLYLAIPCYNEETVLPETARRLREKFTALRAAGTIGPMSRICFIDDGSKDATWQLISDLHARDPVFSGIRLSRNRGHQNALLCGLMTLRNRADCVISMDADLQDDIDAIDAMLAAFSSGNDIVYGVRASRKQDSAFKRATAQGYYRLLRALGADVVYNHADYRLMSRRALDALAEYKEVNLFLRGGIDAHRDIVADELSGKGVTHDMLLSRGVGVHVTESALHDQSAAVAAESLPGEAFAAGETPYDALAADKGGEFRKFGLRYVAVEIHGRKDNPSIWENQTKASNMLCLAAFALLWIAGPGRYAADSRIARRLCTRPPESHSHAVGTPPRRQTPLRWPGFCRPERKTTPSWLRKPKLPTGSPSKNAANFPHRRSESPKRANSRSSTQRTSARRKPISVTHPTTGKPPWRAAFSPAPAKWASTSAAV